MARKWFRSMPANPGAFTQVKGRIECVFVDQLYCTCVQKRAYFSHATRPISHPCRSISLREARSRTCNLLVYRRYVDRTALKEAVRSPHMWVRGKCVSACVSDVWNARPTSSPAVRRRHDLSFKGLDVTHNRHVWSRQPGKIIYSIKTAGTRWQADRLNVYMRGISMTGRHCLRSSYCLGALMFRRDPPQVPTCCRTSEVGLLWLRLEFFPVSFFSLFPSIVSKGSFWKKREEKKKSPLKFWTVGLNFSFGHI